MPLILLVMPLVVVIGADDAALPIPLAPPEVAPVVAPVGVAALLVGTDPAEHTEEATEGRFYRFNHVLNYLHFDSSLVRQFGGLQIEISRFYHKFRIP